METVSTHLARCPFKHSQESLASSTSSSSTIEPLSESKGIHVIVVEKGKDPQKDGQVITASSSDADLAELSRTIAHRFLPNSQGTVLPSAVALEDSAGAPVTTYSQLSELRVVYLSRSLAVKEAPVVPGYPLVGIVPYTLKDARGAMVNFFDTYGDTVHYYLFSSRVFASRDPAVVREMMNDSEYFYKETNYPLSEFKELARDGLFTTTSTEDVWKHAHRLLMPAFSASAMKIYAEEMVH
ncbi:hypothetical protein GGI12_005761, partial [Dipsacomyces acuminosporus]